MENKLKDEKGTIELEKVQITGTESGAVNLAAKVRAKELNTSVTTDLKEEMSQKFQRGRGLTKENPLG